MQVVFTLVFFCFMMDGMNNYNHTGNHHIHRQAYIDLTIIYGQQHRHYHNLNHIHQCLGEFYEYKTKVGCLLKREVEYAIWFHDAIYNPYSNTNEEDSAILFDSYAKQFDLSLDNEIVKQLILGTKGHISLSPNYNLEHNILNDIDLSILATQDSSNYWSYVSAIRKEYQHVSTSVFNNARSKFIEQILSRKKIYQTEYFHSKFETKARKNLEMEKAHLKKI